MIQWLKQDFAVEIGLNLDMFLFNIQGIGSPIQNTQEHDLYEKVLLSKEQ